MYSFLFRVPVPDERFDWLCEHHKPASKVRVGLVSAVSHVDIKSTSKDA
jgi:hypothetical protein